MYVCLCGSSLVWAAGGDRGLMSVFGGALPRHTNRDEYKGSFEPQRIQRLRDCKTGLIAGIFVAGVASRDFEFYFYFVWGFVKLVRSFYFRYLCGQALCNAVYIHIFLNFLNTVFISFSFEEKKTR